MKTGRMLWFVFGNISPETSIEIVEEARKILSFEPASKEELAPARVVNLPLNSESGLLRVDNALVDPKNENSCLITYF